MFDTNIIETVIGLIFVFSLLAIMVTQINGFIVGVLNLRAYQLKEGLQMLITDPELQAKVLAHPIINMVEETVRPEERISAEAAKEVVDANTTSVTWIEPSTFVEALTDILLVQADKVYRSLQAATETIPNSEEKSRIRELIRSLRGGFSEQTVRSLREAFEFVQDPEARQRLLAGLDEVENTLEKLNFKTEGVAPLLEGVRRIADKKLQAALETILTTADSVDEARSKMENWFNEGMSRTSAIYQRRIQFFSIAVAFLITVTFNVDTFHLARSLWVNEELRASVAATAREFDQSAFTDDSQSGDTTGEAETGEPVTTETESDETAAQALGAQSEEIGVTVQKLLELDLPIGWEFTQVTDEMVATSQQLGRADPRDNGRNVWNFLPVNNDNWFSLWLQKIVGLIATTIAVAQGAPFWFDLLNKITRR
jgi:hypothetical protein